MMEVVRTGIPMPTAEITRAAARRSLGIDPDAVVAAWVGRGDPQKRPEDVTPLQERVCPNAIILALGDGLDQYLGDAFTAAGGVRAPAGTPAASVYAASDLLVHTAAWEGLPLVVLEAMQVGLPVVAYAVGGIVEQVSEMHNGHLVSCGDVDVLAERLLTIARDPALHKRMSTAARERTKAVFDYEQMVGHVERVYHGVYAARQNAHESTHNRSRGFVRV
jgi:glycosyltransferase involved in cell wall biosynthesis